MDTITIEKLKKDAIFEFMITNKKMLDDVQRAFEIMEQYKKCEKIEDETNLTLELLDLLREGNDNIRREIEIATKLRTINMFARM